jgi:phage gp16-like protein
MAPQTADKDRERDLRLIHVAKRELALDEETYRAMLCSVAGVRSAKYLDVTGRKKVLDHLKERGFKVKVAAPASNDAADSRYRKIRVLWKQLHDSGKVAHNTEHAVRSYIKRMTHLEDFQLLDDLQVSMVIEALKKWLARSEQPADADASNTKEDSHG